MEEREIRLEGISEHLQTMRDEVSGKWSKLTKSDLAEIDHDFGNLSSALARRYAISAKQARQDAKDFVEGLDTTMKDAPTSSGMSLARRRSRFRATSAIGYNCAAKP